MVARERATWIPEYTANRKEWRRRILAFARRALGPAVSDWNAAGPFEVVVLLYLRKGDDHGKHDLDNRLKDVLDGLQGAFYAKTDGKKRSKRRLIKSDSSVCRVVIEKQERPRISKSSEKPGGRLIVRAYTEQPWPLQA